MLRRISLVTVDFTVMLCAGILSLFIRFGWDFASIGNYFPAVLIASGVASLSFFLFGVYKTVWAYMGNDEIVQIFKSIAVAYFMNLLVVLVFPFVMPRSVGIMQFLGGAFAVLLSRIWWSWYVRRKYQKKGRDVERRIGIMGAGEAGIMLLEDIRKRNRGMKVEVFIDDSRRKIGRNVRGVPVMGPIADVNRIISEKGLDEIIVAIPSADSAQMKIITSHIDLKTVHLKVLPSISEMLEDEVRTEHVRDVAIEDLLGRDPVRIDLKEMEAANTDKTILITGAGGSIGGEITKQLIAMKPKKIVALGRGENSIYQISGKFAPLLKANAIEFVRIIADITNEEAVDRLFKDHKPQVVYHCAAHKHVPLMEENPSEAFRVNSMGTKKLVDIAVRHGVERFTLISTDKAVNPTSIMGTSKRLAEMYLRAVANKNRGTIFSVVRFGNVLGSRGSVIPKFKEQIKNGGPITITDPNMRRFFMTIPEASSLVIQASSFMKNGDLFILDMGEQIYIKDLVDNMVKLAGLIPGQDIEIQYTGIRPGEKLYEELFLDKEKALSTKNPKIYRVIEEEHMSPEEIAGLMEKMYDLCICRDKNDMKKTLDAYIPDHQVELKGGYFDASES